MHHRLTPRKASALLLLAAALAGLLLAGCGGSSSKSAQTATESASATAPGSTGGGSQGSSGATGSTGTTGSSGATGPSGTRGAARFKALRECLQKNGVTLPTRPQGSQGKRPGGGLFEGAQGAPNGVNREKLRAALKKCGAGAGFGPGARAGRARLSSPAFKASLTSFSKCMRENGVNLPAPNTSGKGPVFDTKGIDTSSTTFTNARKKCQSKLGSGFGAGRPPAGSQAGPPPGEGGPPPGAEGGPPPGEGN